MATDKEAGVPISDIIGIHRNVDRELLPPKYAWNLQNLWERELGVHETRPGTSAVSQSFTANITKIKPCVGKLYNTFSSTSGGRRIAPIVRAAQAATIALPSNVTLAMSNDATANWNTTFGAGPNFAADPAKVILRFIGYGVDNYYEIALGSISGYSGASAQKLTVTVGSAFSSDFICIEVYAVCRTGGVYAVGANYYEQTMWVGHIDLITSPTGATEFKYCPVGFASGGAASNTGGTKVLFTALSNPTSGSLKAGTYYVALLNQRVVTNNATTRRCCYQQITTDFTNLSIAADGDVKAVTVPENGSIFVSIDATYRGATPTACWMLAVGTHPQLLQPLYIFNDHGGVDIRNKTSYTVTALPKHSPALIDFTYVAADDATLQFRFSDCSQKDMLVDLDNKVPIFVSRLYNFVNDSANYSDVLALVAPGGLATTPTGLYLYASDASGTPYLQYFGIDADYDYVAWRNWGFLVSSLDPRKQENGAYYQGFVTTSSNILSKTGTAYFMTDGLIAGAAIMDFQSATPYIRIPSGTMIQLFQESICIAGGAPVNDLIAGTVMGLNKSMAFTRPFNPFDFTVAGAAAPVLQYVAIDSGGDDISGLGLYTNTTGSAGPISQLVLSKPNEFWILTNLPVAVSGALPNTFLGQLCKGAGGFHRTFVNTPFGLMCCGPDNVWLLRETGEPEPIGDDISPLLLSGTLTGARATFHKDHYKLSFYNSEFSGNTGYNNVELWLDFNKMKYNKGVPAWKGPMIGRQVDAMYRHLDGSTDDRFIIDCENKRWLKESTPAESDTVIQDISTDVTWLFETKDYQVTGEDDQWDKRFTRTYYKVKCGASITATEKTYVEGDLQENKTIALTGMAGNWKDKRLKTTSIFPPSARYVGDTIRKILTGTARIGIGSIKIHYSVIRRRK